MALDENVIWRCMDINNLHKQLKLVMHPGLIVPDSDVKNTN